MNKAIFQKFEILFYAFSAVLFYYFGYHIERIQFINLFIVYVFLFAFYILFCNNESKYTFWYGVLARGILLFSIPNLSQDIYRFIWDGRLVLEGINPLTSRPINLQNVPNAVWFISKMGTLSANNFSNYPPVCQYIFAFAAWLGNRNIIIEIFTLKSFLLAADIVIYFFGRKILEILKMDTSRILFYFLNPLVILEGCGNAHFEILMMAFFCVSIYFMLVYKTKWSAVFMAMAIATKLIPIFYLLVNFRIKYANKSLGFYGLILLVLSFLFLPFFNFNFLDNYSSTIGLWFGKFEFNASLYYLFRALGFWILGYNINVIYSKGIILILIISIIYLAKKYPKINIKDSLGIFQIFLTFYFLTATTIHPWYLITLVFLNVFSNRKSVLIWSFTIIFSYFAYNNVEFKEYPLVLVLEYILVWPLYILELIYFNSLPINHNEDFKEV